MPNSVERIVKNVFWDVKDTLTKRAVNLTENYRGYIEPKAFAYNSAKNYPGYKEPKAYGLENRTVGKYGLFSPIHDGMDALDTLIKPVVSLIVNPVTLAICTAVLVAITPFCLAGTLLFTAIRLCSHPFIEEYEKESLDDILSYSLILDAKILIAMVAMPVLLVANMLFEITRAITRIVSTVVAFAANNLPSLDESEALFTHPCVTADMSSLFYAL